MLEVMTQQVTLEIFRGDDDGGEMSEYSVEVQEGMVVLDAVHAVQAQHAPDMACRWNCKAGKCGSCSAEVNGHSKLMCMDRLDNYEPGETIAVRPMKTFPVIKDIVCDVSWNYEQNKKIGQLQPRLDTDWLFTQREADRVQEFRKCIECFLCQNVCHVLRDHDRKDDFVGPRFLVRLASLEMHPIDAGDRLEQIKDDYGIGYCNITKCCTEVCPESITITDNAIIPLKERLADRYYDPLAWIRNKLTGR
jgi:succinate dehydrogenase / fumarate reductase iron-sulfur subunit